jgi:hypothetical protein
VTTFKWEPKTINSWPILGLKILQGHTHGNTTINLALGKYNSNSHHCPILGQLLKTTPGPKEGPRNLNLKPLAKSQLNIDN